jgi:hypothetical protein
LIYESIGEISNPDSFESEILKVFEWDICQRRGRKRMRKREGERERGECATETERRSIFT